MAANGRGHMRPNTGSKTPPFLIVGLLIVTGILAFNYWSVSSKNSQLRVEVEELGIKYRSTQNKKVEVEKLNGEHEGEINKLNQQVKDGQQQVEDERRKTQEISEKIDRLAQEMDAVRNDLNTCDDEVGFCHENVTRMIIAHRKQLEEEKSRCRQEITEAQSHGERRAASVQSDCETAIDAKRISILKVVQQVFGTKAIILLRDQAQQDVSGIDLTLQTDQDTIQDQQEQEKLKQEQLQQDQQQQQVQQQPQQQPPAPVVPQQQEFVSQDENNLKDQNTATNTTNEDGQATGEVTVKSDDAREQNKAEENEDDKTLDADQKNDNDTEANNAGFGPPAPVSNNNQIPYQQNIQYQAPIQAQNAPQVPQNQVVDQSQYPPQNQAPFDQQNQAQVDQLNQQPSFQNQSPLGQPALNQAPQGAAFTTRYPQQPAVDQNFVERSQEQSQYSDRQINQGPVLQNVPQESQQQQVVGAPLPSNNEIPQSPVGVPGPAPIPDQFQQPLSQDRSLEVQNPQIVDDRKLNDGNNGLVGQNVDQAQYVAGVGEIDRRPEEIQVQATNQFESNQQQEPLQFQPQQVAQIPEDIRQ